MAASATKVRDTIEQAIQGSDTLGAGNYVTVKVEKSGFLGMGGAKIVLTGRTKSDKDKEAIEALANEKASGVDVESRLRVSKVG